MKAIRAFLVIALFVFMNFGLHAQNKKRGIDKRVNTSNIAPEKTQASFQVIEETQTTPAPANPIPIPYPNTSATPTNSINSAKSNEIIATPSSNSSPNNPTMPTPQQSKTMETKKVENFKK